MADETNPTPDPVSPVTPDTAESVSPTSDPPVAVTPPVSDAEAADEAEDAAEAAIPHPENVAAATSQELPAHPDDSVVPTGAADTPGPVTEPSPATAISADAEPVVAPVPPPVGIVNRDPVDGNVSTVSARSDADALTGFFASVVGGEHKGRYGVVQGSSDLDDDGFPKTVTLRTRDENDEYIVVEYEHVVRDVAGKR